MSLRKRGICAMEVDGSGFAVEQVKLTAWAYRFGVECLGLRVGVSRFVRVGGSRFVRVGGSRFVRVGGSRVVWVGG